MKLEYLCNAINKFAKIVGVQGKPGASQPATTNKPAPPASTTQGDVEYRDRFHGAQGEERQRLIQEEAAKKGFTLIPDKITPVSEAEVVLTVKKLVDQKFPQMDDGDKQEFVFTIVPQIKLECGYRPHNYNLANQHAYPPWKGKVSTWQDPQIENGKKIVNVDWFWKSYSSLEEGAVDWLNLLEKHFPAAFAAAQRGDVETFSKELRNKGYYTADVKTYTKGLKNIKEKMKNKYWRDAH